jgi:hypothetical protein
VSLTSNDASDAVKAFLDEHGGMPMLKGAVEAFAAIARLAAWQRARGPARLRAAAAGLARAGRGSRAVGQRLGARPARPLGGGRSPCRAPEREGLERLSAAGCP